MITDEFYLSGGPILRTDHLYTRQLLYRYSHSSPDAQEERQHILAEPFGHAGDTYIEPSFRRNYSYNALLGSTFYASFNCVTLDVCPTHIDNNCMLVPGVHIYTATHPLDAETRNSDQEYGKPVTIDHNVQIGRQAVVNSGVTIGDNVVIASGAVVAKDIPAGAVAGGSPVQITKRLPLPDP